jgi:chromosome segregation ATPase
MIDRKCENATFDKEVTRLDKLIEGLRQGLSECQTETTANKKEIERLSQFLDMLSRTIKTLQNQLNSNAPQMHAGVDEASFIDLVGRVTNVEGELINLRNEFANWAKNMQDALNQKADIDTLKALEQSILDRLNEMVKALTKNFADKTDTRKAMKLLEKNLKNMYDLFMSRGGRDNEDDAMFTKKPLGGTSCASCAKDVIDLYGKRVEYLPWGKLPYRDPSERIARVG